MDMMTESVVSLYFLIQAEEKEDEEEEVEKPKYFRILRENFPECPFLIFGTFFAAIQGTTMPLFAVFFGEMIKVIKAVSSEKAKYTVMY